MTLALPQENVLDIQNKRMQLTALAKTTIMELIKLLEKLSFTAQAVLPGKIGMPQLITKTNAFKRGWGGGGGGVAGGQSVIKSPREKLGHVRKGQNLSMFWSSMQ